jgi:enterochelin esterase-like enzyme
MRHNRAVRVQQLRRYRVDAMASLAQICGDTNAVLARQMRMMVRMRTRTLLLLTILLAPAARLIAQPQPTPQATHCASAGMGELHVKHFVSKVFPYPQTLRVWLPPGYHDAANFQRQYPVLYMFDGQNIFDDCTSPWHVGWKIDQSLTKLIGEGTVQPIIVVGIDAPDDGPKRASELLAIPDTIGPYKFTPLGERLPQFMTAEVMPRIEHTYRVQTGRSHTAIGGASYGGVAAIYLLKTLPGTFGLGLIESPSGSPGNGEIARWTQNLYEPPLRVAIGVGDQESLHFRDMILKLGLDPDEEDRGFARTTRTVAANLRAVMGDARVHFVEQPDGTHSEDDWAKRFPADISFLFPAK